MKKWLEGLAPGFKLRSLLDDALSGQLQGPEEEEEKPEEDPETSVPFDEDCTDSD